MREKRVSRLQIQISIHFDRIAERIYLTLQSPRRENSIISSEVPVYSLLHYHGQPRLRYRLAVPRARELTMLNTLVQSKVAEEYQSKTLVKQKCSSYSFKSVTRYTFQKYSKYTFQVFTRMFLHRNALSSVSYITEVFSLHFCYEYPESTDTSEKCSFQKFIYHFCFAVECNVLGYQGNWGASLKAEASTINCLQRTCVCIIQRTNDLRNAKKLLRNTKKRL